MYHKMEVFKYMSSEVNIFHSNYVDKDCIGIRVSEHNAVKLLGIVSIGWGLGQIYQVLENKYAKNFSSQYNFVMYSPRERYPQELIDNLNKVLESIDNNENGQ